MKTCLTEFFLEREIFQTKAIENRALYEVRWKNTVKPNRPQTTIWHMRIVCWIPKNANTHLECAILIALPRQKWLHERAQCYVTRILPVIFLSIFTLSTSSFYKKRLLLFLIKTVHCSAPHISILYDEPICDKNSVWHIRNRFPVQYLL